MTRGIEYTRLFFTRTGDKGYENNKFGISDFIDNLIGITGIYAGSLYGISTVYACA